MSAFWSLPCFQSARKAEPVVAVPVNGTHVKPQDGEPVPLEQMADEARATLLKSLESMSKEQLEELKLAVETQLSLKQTAQQHEMEVLREVVVEHLSHRAWEKVSFGIAEHVLEWLAEVALSTAPSASTVSSMAASAVKHGSHAVKASARLAVAPSLLLRSLAIFFQGIKVLIPLGAAFLVGRITTHDLHRMEHEKHKHGYAISTLLFAVAMLCDAMDAIAHLAMVVLMIKEIVEGGQSAHHHADHHDESEFHLEHALHNATLMFAVGATVCIVAGEMISYYVDTRKRIATKSDNSGSATADTKDSPKAEAKGDAKKRKKRNGKKSKTD